MPAQKTTMVRVPKGIIDEYLTLRQELVSLSTTKIVELMLKQAVECEKKKRE